MEILGKQRLAQPLGPTTFLVRVSKVPPLPTLPPSDTVVGTGCLEARAARVSGSSFRNVQHLAPCASSARWCGCLPCAQDFELESGFARIAPAEPGRQVCAPANHCFPTFSSV